MDDSKCDLEKSAELEQTNILTLLNGHATTISDDLDVTNIPHKYYWKTLEGYSPLLDAAMSQGVQSGALRQRDRYASRNLPYQATAGAQHDVTHRLTTTDKKFICLSIQWHTFI